VDGGLTDDLVCWPQMNDEVGRMRTGIRPLPVRACSRSASMGDELTRGGPAFAGAIFHNLLVDYACLRRS
jgi:hypothetical protein